jgi:hypothetical protein
MTSSRFNSATNRLSALFPVWDRPHTGRAAKGAAASDPARFSAMRADAGPGCPERRRTLRLTLPAGHPGSLRRRLRRVRLPGCRRSRPPCRHDDDCLRGDDERERPQAESAGGDTDHSGFGCDSFHPARDLAADVVHQRHAQTQGCRRAPDRGRRSPVTVGTASALTATRAAAPVVIAAAFSRCLHRDLTRERTS